MVRLLTCCVLIALSACGQNGKTCSTYPLTVLPMKTADYRGILPLGNVAPNFGHVFPTPHSYFYVSLDSAGKPLKGPVYAPGDLQVTKLWKNDHFVSASDQTV